MAYAMKELACYPARIKGMSEKLIVSHYENNYCGAVNHLNAITVQLAELDFATPPGFVVNGLKREELIAGNSMILHELFFASLGEESAPAGELCDALTRDFGSVDRWRAEFSAMGKAQGGGSGWVLLTWAPRDRKLVNQWAMDHTTTSPAAVRSWRSICTSIPITWTTGREPPLTSMPSWRSSTGRT
jgi:superoxide dismutase, Fe-Mn family